MKIGTKEHYSQVVDYMTKLMDKVTEKHPDITEDMKELFTGLQIITNEYVLKNLSH